MGQSMRVPASVDELRNVCTFVENVTRGFGMAEWAIFHCELAVEEAFVNIAGYGFEGFEPDEIREYSYVDITIDGDGKALTITICDNSPPFNPLEIEAPDMPAEIEKVETGGLGIHFYKRLMDQVDYEYRDGENRLTLRKDQSA